jgi:putative salt-induced outer membrane protein YdiY
MRDNIIRGRVRSLLLSAALLGTVPILMLPSGLEAQDEDPARVRWVFKGELTSVASRGNSEALTLGLASVIRRRYESSAWKFEGGAVRVETGKISRTASGTADNFTVTKDVDTEKTAESFYARGRYERTVSDAFFLYGGVDWLRNTFAGIDSRTLFAAGGGYTWLDTDRTRFATDFAVTYTFETDVVENPFLDTDFAGVRVGYELTHQVSESTDFESGLVGDLNLSETEDRRVVWANSLTVDVNDIVALKPAIAFSWKNLPALSEVPLFTNGVDTGTKVQAPLEKLDTLFTLALVLTF